MFNLFEMAPNLLNKLSFVPFPETRFATKDGASKDGNAPVSAPYTPRQNRLLAALPADDYERLLPSLAPVRLSLGCILHNANAQRKYLYFPVAGIVSRVCVTHDGASTECAVAGSEGAIGVASFLSGEIQSAGGGPCQAVVLVPGYAYRIGADALNNEFERDVALRDLLLRYIHALMAQTAQLAVCNRHHSLKQQLCRWILTNLDRSRSSVLPVTHQLIADMLGVRREGITQAAGTLQTAGLIRYSRGHINVLDRPRLEAQACECYAVVKREYDRFLPEYRQAEVASWGVPTTLAPVGASA